MDVCFIIRRSTQGNRQNHVVLRPVFEHNRYLPAQKV
jgi:hypothetical protein